VKARLIEDGGTAASSDEDFFRSPAFLAVEGTTHSLVIGEALAAPVIVREIPGGGTDATSPYGYPGFSRGSGDALGSEPGAGPPLDPGPALDSGPPLDPDSIEFSETGLVSAFVRHALGGEPPLDGARPRNLCLLADPSLDRKSRMSDRQQIRKNLKRGYEVEVVEGSATTDTDRQAFLAAYTQTMDRTGAAGRYYFDAGYFWPIFDSGLAWLAVAREPGGALAAGSLVVVSDGMLHYYLSGTADEHLRDSPMKNLLSGIIDFAEQRGMPLNLGGGITPGDRLEEFKRGFANREEQWYTSELICDPEAYDRLSRGAGADPGSEFFPAYRA
jgi:hypothetical protein